MAVVKFNPDTIKNRQFDDNDDDRIDILSRKVKSMDALISRMAENMNKMEFNVKTNSEIISTLDEKTQRIVEATCDNFNKTEEQIEAIQADISSVRNGVSSLEEDIKNIHTNQTNAETNQSASNDICTPAPKVITVDSDEEFWFALINEANVLSKTERKKKPEIATVLASEYGYGDTLWMNVLGFIWSSRKAGKNSREIAQSLNSRHQLKIKKTVDPFDISAPDEMFKSPSPTPVSVEAPVTNQTVESPRDSFLDILKAMGYEVLDSDTRYTVKDASGRTCEVSRKAFEASMNDIFKAKEVE